MPANFRDVIISHFGFWPGKLSAALHGNPSADNLIGLATYGLIHGGILHLVMNGIGLLSLGKPCATGMKWWKFTLFFWLISILAGLFYGLALSRTNPTVGASGALFGCYAFAVRQNIQRGWGWPWARKVLLEMFILNLVLTLATGGLLAWEVHAGGFIFGWILAPLFWTKRPKIWH